MQPPKAYVVFANCSPSSAICSVKQAKACEPAHLVIAIILNAIEV